MKFRPDPPPTTDSFADFRDWIYRQFLKLSAEDVKHYETLYAAPSKPREGDTVKADGTTWNPGSGAGIYLYQSGSWVKL